MVFWTFQPCCATMCSVQPDRPPGGGGRERMLPLKIDILGVGFDNLTPEETVQAAVALMDQGGFHYAVTPNPEFILAARKNPAVTA